MSTEIVTASKGFLWAVYTVLGKKMLESYKAEDLTTYAFITGTLLLFPFAFLRGLKKASESWTAPGKRYPSACRNILSPFAELPAEGSAYPFPITKA